MTKIKVARVLAAADPRPAHIQFFEQNYPALVERLRRPSWRALSIELASQGITGPDGNPVSPAALRLAWYRVRREKEATAAKRTEPRVFVPSPRPEVTGLPKKPSPAGADHSVEAQIASLRRAQGATKPSIPKMVRPTAKERP